MKVYFGNRTSAEHVEWNGKNALQQTHGPHARSRSAKQMPLLLNYNKNIESIEITAQNISIDTLQRTTEYK